MPQLRGSQNTTQFIIIVLVTIPVIDSDFALYELKQKWKGFLQTGKMTNNQIKKILCFYDSNSRHLYQWLTRTKLA